MANYMAAAMAALVVTWSAAGAAARTATASGNDAARYVQASSGSSLKFIFTQAGASGTGQFTRFTTRLNLDPASPSGGSLQVSVVMDSVDTGDAERDELLKSATMFDAESHGEATYVADQLVRGASGQLEAVGKLTLRGVSRSLRLPLAPKKTADGLELSGEATIRRLDFGVGQGDMKSTKSVGDAVKLVYKVALVRAAN